MSILNLLQSVVAYDDTQITTVNNNPFLRVGDWQRNYFGISVNNPLSQKFTIPANASLTLFDGTRTLTLDNTTVVSITNTSGSTYRISNVSGTLAGFRTNRAIAVDATTQWTVSVNNNSLVTLTNSAGTTPSLGTVVAGDMLYLGPNSGFNVLNQGYYSIVSSTTNSVSIQNNNAIAETATLGSSFATNFLIYASAGVQVGDTMILSAGFSTITLGNYIVTAVTSLFVEFSATSPLPLQASVTPTASGMVFYSACKFLIYLETNQSCVLRINSDVSNNNIVQPFSLDNPGQPDSGIKGLYTKIGPSYRAVIVNQSLLSSCIVYIFTAEHV